MSFKSIGKWCLVLLFPLVAFLAIAHPLRGLSCLVVGSDRRDAVDLKLRWTEERYFLRGKNPFDVWSSHSPRAAQNGISFGRPAEVERDIGGPDPAHPPWGYVTGLFYLWPSWPAVRVYFAGLNL